jgi:hypothetical protein
MFEEYDNKLLEIIEKEGVLHVDNETCREYISTWKTLFSVFFEEVKKNINMYYVFQKVFPLDTFVILDDTKHLYSDLYTINGRLFSYAIFPKNVVEELARIIGNQSMLSVGSGRGLLEKLLFNEGINIKATDIVNYDYTYSDVESIDGESAIEKYECDILICVYPNPFSSWCTDCIKKFKGKKIIYIGDEKCVVTGDKTLLEYMDNKCNIIKKIQLPTWNYYSKNFLFSTETSIIILEKIIL